MPKVAALKVLNSMRGLSWLCGFRHGLASGRAPLSPSLAAFPMCHVAAHYIRRSPAGYQFAYRAVHNVTGGKAVETFRM